MPSRMTRYEDESIKNMSRSNRNQKLYDSFNDNTITLIDNSNTDKSNDTEVDDTNKVIDDTENQNINGGN